MLGARQIWDDRPAFTNSSAVAMNTAYPIGNGRLGAMVSGLVARETIQFNVDSLWTGDANLSGATGEVESVATDATVGDYQNFGTLVVNFKGVDEKSVSGYVRTLDLETALCTVAFTVHGPDGPVEVRREAFASAPADVLAFRFVSSKPLEGTVRLRGAHSERTRNLGPASLGFAGVLPNGLAYAARADWTNDGGTNLVVFLRAKTGYDLKRADFGLGVECPQFAGPFAGDFDALKEAHIADYRRWFGRVHLDLGAGPADSPAWNELCTRKKVEYLRGGEGLIGYLTLEDFDAKEREIAATLFDFGRYLLISCSRPGTLPANLQGLWNNKNRPPWHSDYHTNINLQMNYWAVDTANLSGLWDPVADYLLAVRRTAATETRLAFPDSDGVAYRTSMNAFGGGGWKWNFAGAPWMAIMAYDHYLFTRDREYLREKAMPLLADASMFMLSHLVAGPEGTLLVKAGWSPEHGPVADGVMHDQQIMAELLIDTIAAAKELEIDGLVDVATLENVLSRLGGNKIGSWGQLQEWQQDIDVKGDDHRHTSHLFAVYPGTTISRQATPELAAAAIVSLSEGRTTTYDSRRSWTWPWRSALWARLGDGKRAGEMVAGLIEYNLLPNLFATHPPFQIDGNLGFTAAVCEMLMQSHERTADGKVLIRLLPGLPPEWPAGRVSGLKARGGYTVDFEWEAGRVKTFRIYDGDPNGYEVAL